MFYSISGSFWYVQQKRGNETQERIKRKVKQEIKLQLKNLWHINILYIYFVIRRTKSDQNLVGRFDSSNIY